MTEDDKKEYIRSVLGQRPFIKEYVILGTRPVCFKTLTVKESIKLSELENRLDDNTTLIDIIRILFHIENDTPEVIAKLKENSITEDLIKDFVIYAESLTEEYIGCLLKVYNQFIDLIKSLRKEAANADFWKSAG